MPKEEIVTALKNAIDHGESLQDATQIMINSGYNSQEVQEASKFVGASSLNIQEPEQGLELTMPEEKGNFFSKLMFWKRKKSNNQEIPKPSESMKLSSESINKQKIIKKEIIQQPIKQQTHQQQVQQQVPQQIQQQAMNNQIRTQQQVQQQQIKQTQQVQQPVQQLRTQIQKPTPRPIPQIIPRQGPLSKDLKKIKPRKYTHLKEIILLAVLLILIGILAVTIIYRETILSWFS